MESDFTIMTTSNKKLKELILHIAKESEGDQYFGATKLNKLLFYCDFFAFRFHGASITKQVYQKLDYGPSPRGVVPATRELTENNELAIAAHNCYGKIQKKPVALRDADLGEFSGEEIALVSQIIKQFWNDSANDISRKSHMFIGWRLAQIGEDIPYQIALVDTNPTVRENDVQYARGLLAEAKQLLKA